jgi:hypothetical protein
LTRRGFLILAGAGGGLMVAGPLAGTANLPLVVGSGVGTLLGFVGYPVWAIVLGRRLTGLRSAP